ncbi:MAG: pyruvate, phosphate dikinase [Alphaproteobacteria bacterium]|nr:pyruvate, phosphate dikinase [Alphaproteobacteria bacterium]MBF0251271.1 pyruvate, phosphate dikinase [Alphaproteobacteria bacterium]
MSNKWTYSFGAKTAEGRANMRNLLGGKGANLHEMSAIGLHVPPGFTITTEVCTHFTKTEGHYPEGLKDQVQDAVRKIEEIMNAPFTHAGQDDDRILLLSVRSGARASMPGMMDTVLNLGLNDTTVKMLARKSGDERFAYDSYRRFIQMFGDVVLGVEHFRFEDLLEAYKSTHDLVLDTDLTAEDWKTLVPRYISIVEEHTGKAFPQDPMEQLWAAIGAVFGSWSNKRAQTYRRLHGIPESWGTAVNVQAMVFGNMGEDSATGVCFSRNPSTGENVFYGEYLVNAQGEDVVAGIRTPQPLSLAEKQAAGMDLPSLEEVMPELYAELDGVRHTLEEHYKDMQDMEFTIQHGVLWILQTRGGKRTTKAALKIAVDMVNEGLIDKNEAIRRIEPGHLDQLLHPTLDPDAPREILGRGLPASPGAASGKLVFNAKDAEDWVGRGEDVILARVETSPDDIGGMHVSKGILTTRGGMTSHAAVVARGMGTPCVSGAGDIKVDVNAKTLTALGEVLREGDLVTLDGSTGEVMKGLVPTVDPELSGDFAILMEWVDEVRRLGVRANAETPEDAKVARGFGAEGIGLARTEHMFFDPQRIIHMREMILAKSVDDRRAALDKLLPYQRQDFADLFTIMEGLPVTVRLLDPPLHEFLPVTQKDVDEVADELGVAADEIRARSEDLHEFNPMLGHRGCRLAITYPEIYEMQTRAIFEAACDLADKGVKAHPEVMIPLVADREELSRLKRLVVETAEAVMEARGVKVAYQVGTMIELPRAALLAGELAKDAEFFSFGTNDLTQTTFGLSRDDAGRFLTVYTQQGVLATDPFVTLDRDGVGQLVRMGVERGRAVRDGLKAGICGEHGGDPSSIRFCHDVGLDYVSCSPYRVPIARLAAAQAALGVDAETNA